MSQDELSLWQQAEVPDNLTVEQMDALIRDLRDTKTHSDALAESAAEAKKAYDQRRALVLAALKVLKRDSYAVDGHGLAYIAYKEVYTVPKTNNDKKMLFDYIKAKYGPDALMAMVGIHSATLTSWANKETETGEVMTIPGLDQPTMIETLNFRKK